jgi:hypothetical protein
MFIPRSPRLRVSQESSFLAQSLIEIRDEILRGLEAD